VAAIVGLDRELSGKMYRHARMREYG